MKIIGHIVLIDAKIGPDFELHNTPVVYHFHPSKIQRAYRLSGDTWWRLVLDGKFAIITHNEPTKFLEWVEKGKTNG